MLRIETPARTDWPKIVESQGLLFHSIDGVPYWDEGAYYLFESAEVDAIEKATYRLNEMCLEAVEHVVKDRRLGELGIPEAYHGWVAWSWERDEHTIYGRFDLQFDGSGPAKLLEYNADTPTALLEAAVIQWFWSRDLLASAGIDPADGPFDQFNSIHERLIEAWKRVRHDLGGRAAFAAPGGALEDVMTVSYLRDTAIQAGLKTQFLDMEQIGWHAGRGTFTDLQERSIEILFKLYPWEWMLHEPFGRHLPLGRTHWLEPPWKMILSNKAILPILWELFPESPYLLRCGFEPIGSTYVSKPFYSREGADVTIVRDGQILAETPGDDEGPRVYQAFRPLPEFNGRHPVVGSWIVNGYACGVGLREDDGLITRNTSRFVPHLFRQSTAARPPILDPKRVPAKAEAARSTGDPLWDPWLDR